MKRYGILLLLLTSFLMLWTVSGGVSAQNGKGDDDGDGVLNYQDQCPTVPGPASNNGCPLPQPTPQPLGHPPGDTDGDGTLDVNDQCPLDGGPDWNNGCPTDQTAPSQPTAAVTLPTTGPCVVATTGQDRVNMRAMPSTTADIVGAMNPALLYPVYATSTGDSGIWYLVKAGWSAGRVLRTGGACDTLPAFDFGDVTLNFLAGPGDALTLNFVPVPGGAPFVNLRPFAGPAGEGASLNFTKAADAFPDAGFSFVLVPLPGANSGGEPGANPQVPGSDVFDDGYLLDHMGDGSVFIMMPPALQGADNPLNGILIGLSQPAIDPNHILIGLSQPTIDPSQILIGLSQPAGSQDTPCPPPHGCDQLNGILIGLLLPAVQTGDTNLTGILIGLLLPAVQTADSTSAIYGFSGEPFGGGTQAAGGGGGTGSGQVGGGTSNLPPSMQEIQGMGLNFWVPGAGGSTRQLFTAGWGVEIEGIVAPDQ